jgi:hypothetical protein
MKEEYSLKEERKKIKDKCIIDETKSSFKFFLHFFSLFLLTFFPQNNTD